MDQKKDVMNKESILIVDDDRGHLMQTKAGLLPYGYDVLTVSNGKEALQIIKDEDVDLILLDVKMPGMDGFEITKRVKTDERTKFTPIILITTLQDTADKLKGIEAGCDDFIRKPFDQNELLVKLRSLLKIKLLHDELERNCKQLQEMEEVKKNLTKIIVHDLNNLLAIVSGRIELLSMNEQEKFTNEQKKDLEIAFSSAKDMKKIIGSLMDVQNMGGK